ncbi:hypothetical protein NL436_28600, partial [Klebsiella pneumoniae]|nr:hypothetical protein [Klebsiella pneumoniae]
QFTLVRSNAAPPVALTVVISPQQTHNHTHTMGKIQFGSEVYTWFMQGTGKGYDNKLDHMIKVASEAGFTGIEPMVLE